MKRYLLSALTLSLLAGYVMAADPAPSAAPAAAAVANSTSTSAARISGIDVQYIDPSVRAQDDIFVHLNGKWLATTEIPADK